MAIQSFRTYEGLSDVGLDVRTHRRIVARLRSFGSDDRVWGPARNQVLNIGHRAGISGSTEIINLYGLLRVDPQNEFGRVVLPLDLCSDPELVREALAVYANIGGMETLEDFYSAVFNGRAASRRLDELRDIREMEEALESGDTSGRRPLNYGSNC